VNYQVFAGTASGQLSEARGLVNAVKPAFLDTFGINLVEQGNGTSTTLLDQKPGCQWMTPPNDFCVYMPSNPSLSCGPFNRCHLDHHRSISTINDLLWFDDDFIFEQLSIEPEDD